jgi:uncharacterized membrane protein
MLGVNLTTWLFQIVNFLILVGWIVLVIVALTRLRRCQLDETARVLWAIVIVLVPLMGALAFVIVRPGKPRPDEER